MWHVLPTVVSHLFVGHHTMPKGQMAYDKIKNTLIDTKSISLT